MGQQWGPARECARQPRRQRGPNQRPRSAELFPPVHPRRRAAATRGRAPAREGAGARPRAQGHRTAAHHARSRARRRRRRTGADAAAAGRARALSGRAAPHPPRTARGAPRPRCRNRPAGQRAQGGKHRAGSGAARDRRDPAGMAAPPAVRDRTSRRSRERDAGGNPGMTQRGRWTLALLTAVLIGAAIYVSTPRRTDRPAGIGWRVAERAGYPADASRVRTLLLGLAQARTIEEKTTLPANYPSLGVEDLATPGATGTGVELAGPAEPVSLIVGKSPGARASYIRRKGEAASWQIGTALTVERDPAKWLATELLDIGADRIQSAEFTMDGKRRWTVAKTSRADQSFKVTGKPAGGSGADAESSAGRVATALGGLRLVDVRPAEGVAKDKPAATATYRTFDGLVLVIDGYAEGDKRFVRVKPSADETAARRFFVAAVAPAGKDDAADSTPPKPPAAEASGAKSAPAKSPESVVAQTREEATRLETRLAGWWFEIPAWSYDAVFPGKPVPR